MIRVRTHPGEVLREEFLTPLGMSAHQLADAIDVPANRISEIVRENRSVTADTALRLAAHFRTTPEFWLNLQTAYDLSKALADAGATVTEIIKRSRNRTHQQAAAIKRTSSTGEFTLHRWEGLAGLTSSSRQRKTVRKIDPKKK